MQTGEPVVGVEIAGGGEALTEGNILVPRNMYVLICRGVSVISKEVCLIVKNLQLVLNHRSGEVLKKRNFINRALKKVLTISGWDLQ